MNRRAVGGWVEVDRHSDCGLMGETDGGRTDRPLDVQTDGRRDDG